MIGMGKKAFKSHLLKTFHHLLEAFFGQLGCTFHPCYSFKNLAIGFLIQVEVFLSDMDNSLFFLPIGIFSIIPQMGWEKEIRRGRTSN
jgi:hypothetical protein